MDLKDIKSRINSVKNTQKITRAMKMVAAAKVKKAEYTVKATRPFSSELLIMFKRMLATIGEKNDIQDNGEKYAHPINNYPALLTRREIKTEGIIVVTSNKGLAGAYNANIVRAVLKRIEENTEKGIETKLYVVGQKGVSALQHKEGTNIVKKYINSILPEELKFISEEPLFYFYVNQVFPVFPNAYLRDIYENFGSKEGNEKLITLHYSSIEAWG